MYQFKPKSKTFKGNVVFKELDENGRSVSNTIEMEFRRFTQRQLDVLKTAHGFPKDDDGNFLDINADESLDVQASQVQELITGWSIRDEHGDPMPFTRENIITLLDVTPGLFLAIWKVVNAGISGEIARKNG